MRSGWIVVVVGLAVACGPIGPIAGRRLGGETGPARVASWDFASGVENAQLETNPAQPHSINCWFAGVGPALYVSTSMIRGPENPAERTWVMNVTSDPRVRIRIDGVIYERRALRVLERTEYENALGALEAKYGIDPADRAPERAIWIFRLDARQGGS